MGQIHLVFLFLGYPSLGPRELGSGPFELDPLPPGDEILRPSILGCIKLTITLFFKVNTLICLGADIVRLRI